MQEIGFTDSKASRNMKRREGMRTLRGVGERAGRAARRVKCHVKRKLLRVKSRGTSIGKSPGWTWGKASGNATTKQAEIEVMIKSL